MANTISPNMGLIVPGVGTEPSPDWANDINSDLGTLDQHNHSAGQGVQINPSGLDINSDLTFNSNNITSLKTINFNSQSASLPGSSPNLGCVYVAGNELFYNDEAGNVVAITNNGTVNAGAGSINGLPSGTASASYSGGSSTFVWQSATSTPANLDAGSVVLRNVVANSDGLTLNPPSSLASNYSVTLPPTNSSGAKVFMTYDTSNNMGLGPTVTAGIAQANLAPRSLGASVGAGGVALSTSCGNFVITSTGIPVLVTNLSVTIVTTGRPVFVSLVDDGSGSVSNIFVQGNPNSIEVQILNGVNAIVTTQVLIEAAGLPGAVQSNVPTSSVQILDTSVNGAAGTYTYTIQATMTGTGTSGVTFSKLLAYEI